MELKEIKCWYCGNPIEEIISKHHLFNITDIRKRLYDTFKAPETDAEHIMMHQVISLVKANTPSFPVHLDCHKEIEKKLTIIKNKQEIKITELRKEIDEISKEVEKLKGGEKGK